ncbi:hypothetical protein A5697_06950 [Mycobacterium sp. E3251]|uniref:hypothetical protein n=1 Tax=Mycobacterium sp. E3251 TaxID=1834144 RepID=UPI0008015291|nr:hypothetical protein [Mycobacterium sp. E3251]OBG92642.1 hypothetical protein A5697_06950 [Mycobacterium sp. E3251]
MTLFLGMSKPEGIYVSTDYRMSDANGIPLDDDRVKHLTVHYPPEGGPKALFGFTGLLETHDGIRVGDWLRETIRGVNEPLEVSMDRLKRRLTEEFAHRGHPLCINFLIIDGEKRYIGELANLEIPDAATGAYKLLDSFYFRAKEITEPYVFANGSGRKLVMTGRNHEVLKRQVSKRLTQPELHMQLLAAVNRRVAKTDQQVSPFCHVSFIGADDSYPPQSRVFTLDGESVTFRMPLIWMGIDTSFPMEAFTAGIDLSSIPPEEWNKNLKRLE